VKIKWSVTDILFEKNGVKYIRKAPEVPDRDSHSDIGESDAQGVGLKHRGHTKGAL